MPTIDEVAKAIYESRPRRIPWEELSEVGWKAEYRQMAEAAIGTMELTEERQVRARDPYDVVKRYIRLVSPWTEVS